MEIEEYVAAIEREGHRLVEAARRAGTDAPVPRCPGWRTADLLAHVGFVHRWATSYVSTAIVEMIEEPDEQQVLSAAPPDRDRGARVLDGLEALVAALRGAPADLRCWTFLDAPSPLAMWARRQAHETTVHRVDAELAAGGPDAVRAVDAELAADGIDELLLAFFARPQPPRADRSTPGPARARTIGLVPADRPERWRVRVPETGAEVAAERVPDEGWTHADVMVRASAGDLYRLLWHRRALRGLEVEGPAGLFDRLWGPHRVTWS